jgi:hypothetical protein
VAVFAVDDHAARTRSYRRQCPAFSTAADRSRYQIHRSKGYCSAAGAVAQLTDGKV